MKQQKLQKSKQQNPTFKTVKVNNDIVGYPCGNTWKWTEKARDHFSQEEFDMAVAYASQQ